MKVVHRNITPVSSGEDLLKEAMIFEKDGAPEQAEKLYLRYLKKIPGSEYAFSRLMILYRKQRDPVKEMAIINRAIKTFQEIFKRTAKVSPSRKTVEISRQLIRSMGLAGDQGDLNEREPLRTWRKRREILEKRTKAAKKRAVKATTKGRRK